VSGVEEIRIVRRIAAPIERVFDAVSDHEHFIRDAVTRTRVIRPGSPDRNGLGCQRQVRAPLIRFVEEVTKWEPPFHYEYWIRESSLPILHHGGGLTLAARDGDTEIDWQTRFEIPIRGLGPILGPPMAWVLGRVFKQLLAATKRRLEAPAA
jgi:uncharacterized protein YndB with AHSA1/START domain